MWFREDLRLADNPALTAAAENGRPVLALYLLDEISPGIRPLGGASRWWLHHSLARLGAALAERGIPLLLRRGAAVEVVPEVARQLGAGVVTCNSRYGAAEQRVDDAVAAALREDGRALHETTGHLLMPPGSVLTGSGQSFKVFTPFWRAMQAAGGFRKPLPIPARLRGAPAPDPGEALADWGLHPTKPDWSGGLAQAFTPGEAGAQARLSAFLSQEFAGYAERRNRPDHPATSRLSPHLRFGEISPVRLYHAANTAVESGQTRASDEDLRVFHSEIGWREFAYNLLVQFPKLATDNFSRKFDAFPWRHDAVELRRWHRGQTGYPIVDAGMRQLWQTGWMHNRVRMIVGSFLVKHLLIDWRDGEAWFWDTLVDADPASNTASWQWVAGTGADAAPYFRIFNPVTQGEKFDPDGSYVRQFVPELAQMPAAHIHQPWEAPPLVLRGAGVQLGTTYPRPMVDHAMARERALAALAETRAA
jgi:deoxyribodipyrimidine photo-lyase